MFSNIIDRYPETWSIQYNNHQYQWYSRWFKLKYPQSNSTMHPTIIPHPQPPLASLLTAAAAPPGKVRLARVPEEQRDSAISPICPVTTALLDISFNCTKHWSCCAMQFSSWDKPCHLHYWSLYKYDINTSAFTGRCLPAVLWLLAATSDHLWCVAAGILDPVLDMWKWSGCCKLAYLLSINCS